LEHSAEEASVVEKGGSAAGETDQPGEGPWSDRPTGQEAPAASEAEPQSAEASAAQVAQSENSSEGAAVAEAPLEELEHLRAELAQTKDHLLRAYAELDNYRKRVSQQIEQERRYAELALLRDLLPVLDDLYRAIEAGEKSGEASGLLAGVRMITEHLEQVLARHHCFRIEAEGKPFDPNLHEAVGQQPSDTYPPNTVLQVVRTGYQLHDRLVRPAQVIISVGPAPAPANN
jgi:molecular chaperone GrpE